LESTFFSSKFCQNRRTARQEFSQKSPNRLKPDLRPAKAGTPAKAGPCPAKAGPTSWSTLPRSFATLASLRPWLASPPASSLISAHAPGSRSTRTHPSSGPVPPLAPPAARLARPSAPPQPSSALARSASSPAQVAAPPSAVPPQACTNAPADRPWLPRSRPIRLTSGTQHARPAPSHLHPSSLLPRTPASDAAHASHPPPLPTVQAPATAGPPHGCPHSARSLTTRQRPPLVRFRSPRLIHHAPPKTGNSRPHRLKPVYIIHIRFDPFDIIIPLLTSICPFDIKSGVILTQILTTFVSPFCPKFLGIDMCV
jgi:hypothetical protein